MMRTYTYVICKEKNILHAQAHALIPPSLHFWEFWQRILDTINIIFCDNNFWEVRFRKISIIRKPLLFPHWNCFLDRERVRSYNWWARICIYVCVYIYITGWTRKKMVIVLTWEPSSQSLVSCTIESPWPWLWRCTCLDISKSMALLIDENEFKFFISTCQSNIKSNISIYILYTRYNIIDSASQKVHKRKATVRRSKYS